MPRTTLAILFVIVIALAAVTVWIVAIAGGLAPFGIVALLALTVGLRFLATKR
ncbi:MULTISPECIES: hypothetical protein [Rhodobacterales]|uniref:hypothetical protein n=1 Tax=Rhodobacterales TaxID=204455 RepID=UPI0015F02FBA|nr:MULTISPECIES: hypothetical protein [Rhodobacterales]MDO6590732.1 hypothetical protein [Yoonia sp. 1_MG-2023]